MEFTVDREKALDALSQVIGIVPNRATLPILQHIHVLAEDGFVTFTGTDLVVLSRVSVSARIIKSGDVCLDARILYDSLGLMSHSDVSFVVNEASRIHITSGSDYIEIDGESSSKYVFIPQPDESAPFVLFEAKNQLGSIFNTVSHAVCDDLARPALTMVNVRFEKGKIRFAATDAYRLALSDIPLSYPESIDGVEINIPKSLLEVFGKALSRCGSARLFLVGRDFSRLDLITDDGSFVSGRLDGLKYPDFTGILNHAGSQETVINTAQFIRAVKLGAVISHFHSQNMIWLSIDSSNGPEISLKVSSSAAAVGASAAYVRGVKTSRDDIEIAVDSNYVLAALNACPSDELTMHLNGMALPAHFRSNDSAINWHAVVMPVDARPNM